MYCSVPTSPGGLYRTPLGRLIFKTDEMAQVVQAPDVVKNKVSFSVFGFDGAVSLKGKKQTPSVNSFSIQTGRDKSAQQY